MAKSHEIDYQIYGDDLQFVEVELDPQETVVAEAGVMMFMDEGIKFETKMGDGSEPEQGFMGKLFSAGKRALTGESLFMTHFTNQGNSKQRVAFGAPYPGKIVALDLDSVNGYLICQKDSFLCAALSLAGLGEDSSGRHPGKNQTKPTKGAAQCQLVPRAADGNAIGDLRAMLLAARHAPKTVPCDSSQIAKDDLRLRIVISGQGKIERSEILGGDPRIGNLVLAKLTGQTCAPRPQGGTMGEIILSLKAPKRTG